MDDAHRDARRTRGAGERQELADGGGVIAERAGERIGRRRVAGGERDRRVAQRTGERPAGHVPGARNEAVGLCAREPRDGLWAGGLRAVEVALKGHATSVGPRCAGPAIAAILGGR